MELDREPRAGDLLVASAALSEGIFAASVVLLLDHDEDGTLGVILNRPSRIDLADALPMWVEAVTQPAEMFEGGPISPNGAICLAALMPGATQEPPGWKRLFDTVGLLHLDTPVEIIRGAFADLRIFAGYSGWEPGQLDSELERGSWHLVPATYGDIFGQDTVSLWRTVLHRQGGDLAYFATWTDRPDTN